MARDHQDPLSPGLAMESQFSLHNEERPLDVNDNGSIEPFDVLLIVNHLNFEPVMPPAFLDVDGNGIITPFDAQQVINHLNEGQPVPANAIARQDLGAALYADERDSRELPTSQLEVASVTVESPRSRPTDLCIGRVESLFKS